MTTHKRIGDLVINLTGINIYQKRKTQEIVDARCLFDYIMREKCKSTLSKIVDHYRKLLNDGVDISCYRADDCFWTDMGTPVDYLNLHRGLLENDIPCWSDVGTVRRPYCIDKKAKLPATIELSSWACIGGAHIENGSHLERVIIWDDVCVPAGSRLVDEIVSGYGDAQE